ncbi:PREDICTED: uncharacterized protein LOC104800116 [Tarenaya hassleriana]|uniref:uncharacterized protein LOC104800116 n=1 Tax=Tarenaya hassleriana TaxID=28532 RepID=UPI00053C90CB|nr:PREDICTED: uncharacterized protein LOC104800116 [Tarenaya hassleriana]
MMDPPRIPHTARRPDPINLPAPARRRTFSSSSFSSMSSCSSTSGVFSGDSPLNSPATPLRILGVPFSWEHLPGKPKEPHSLKLNEPINLLPLPPHRSFCFPPTGKHLNPSSSNKKNIPDSPMKDPFTAALVECSKEEEEEEEEEEDDDEGDVDRNSRRFGRKVNGGSSKALSKSNVGDRFRLVNLYGSCRRTCAVSESIVFLPRSSGASSDHHLLLRRRR